MWCGVCVCVCLWCVWCGVCDVCGVMCVCCMVYVWCVRVCVRVCFFALKLELNVVVAVLSRVK